MAAMAAEVKQLDTFKRPFPEAEPRVRRAREDGSDAEIWRDDTDASIALIVSACALFPQLRIASPNKYRNGGCVVAAADDGELTVWFDAADEFIVGGRAVEYKHDRHYYRTHAELVKALRAALNAEEVKAEVSTVPDEGDMVGYAANDGKKKRRGRRHRGQRKGKAANGDTSDGE